MVIQKHLLRRITKFSRAFLTVLLCVATTGLPGLCIRKSIASDWMPMLPDQDFYDFQLFAPPDLGSYNIWNRDDDGFYFNYDKLYWGITVPRTTTVGRTPGENGVSVIPQAPISPFTIADLNNDYIEFAQSNPIVVSSTAPGAASQVEIVPNVSPQTSLFEIGADPLRLDLNSSWLRTKMTMGDRYEGGWSYGGRGVHISYFQLGKQDQVFGTSNEFAANSPTQEFTFENQGTGGGGGGGNNNGGGGGGAIQGVNLETTVDSPPPDHLITQNLYQRNTTEIQSASVALTLKKNLGRRRGSTQARFSLGPRFVQLADRFELDYTSFQNTFNSSSGGGGNNGGGNNNNTGGNNNNTGGNNNNTGGNNNNTGGNNNNAGGNNGGNNTTTGAAGNVQTTFTSSGGGAGILGITTGDLPATITGTGAGSLFQAAQWETFTSNNMVGPEFGMMFEGSEGRWEWYAGGSFTAGFNWQNNIYKGAQLPVNIGADYLRTNFAGGGLTTVDVAQAGESLTGGSTITTANVPTSPLITQLFPTGQSNATNSAEHRFTFAPIGEWRFGGKFRVSQAVSINFGYTGMWLSQIARAASNTAYEIVPQLTARATRNNTGNTVVVDGNNVLKGTLGGVPYDPGAGDRLVAPTVDITTGTGAGATTTTLPNQEQYIDFINSPYVRQVTGNSGNEYVFTNGVDFGIEVKY